MGTNTKLTFLAALAAFVVILLLIFINNDGSSKDSETKYTKTDSSSKEEQTLEKIEETEQVDEATAFPSYLCETIDVEFDEVKRHFKRKSGFVTSISENIALLSLPQSGKEHLAQEYGVTVSQYRKATSGFSNDYTELFPEIEDETEFRTLQANVLAELIGLMKLRDYEGLFDLISEYGIDNNTIIGGDSLLASIIKNTSELPIELTSGLIELGIQPKFYDLYVATKYSIKHEQLLHLSSYTSVDIEREWFEENRRHTLSTIALRNLDEESLRFWINKGVTLTSYEDDLNASDTYAEALINRDYVADLFLDELVNAKIIPFDKSNKLKLLDQFTDSLKAKYPAYFQELAKDNDPKITLPDEMQQAADESKKQLLELSKAIEKNEKTIESCRKLEEESEAIAKENMIKDKYIAHKITQHQKNGEWDTVLRSYYELAAEYSHDGIISFAISKGAPKKIIMDPVLKGYEIPKEALFILIDDNNLDVLTEFAHYGFLSTIDFGEGESAISYALRQSASEEIVELLKSN